ncbi:phosphatidate cytidylyltransferase [Polluticaenibacter yanchengensis]|uniref:Phosphatidate cytidylyltransferase n=1 Tax=Polluticaenibacter yanchengensis TaxID=3014562 RepID=A0ABT4UFF7_9BACT|nr:phosphatidate cytidylyltransferase [Chitinophagaceae bacterium LY-5]
MALNKEVFKTRALSALIFVAVMMAGLLINHWSFLLLFVIIHFGCWYEYCKLVDKIYHVKLPTLFKYGIAAIGFSLFLAFCKYPYEIAGYSLNNNLVIPFAFAGFTAMAIGLIKADRGINISAVLLSLLGIIYISISLGAMVAFRISEYDFGNGLVTNLSNGISIPLLIIFSVWLNDTCAYLVGSFIGKTPFSKISPKKTWEGTIGGAVLCIALIGTVGSYLFFGKVTLLAFLIGAIGAVIGTLGDLWESKLKRMANVKDSGNMLPGHGGFLDRFDSMLLATPVVLILVIMLQSA